MRWFIFCFGLTGWILGAGCGHDIPPQVATLGLPIVNGQPDTSDEHMAVVGITFGNYMCSGTLIAPDVVLTAGHCAGSPASSYSVKFSHGLIYMPTATRSVSEVHRHPDYDANYVINDIALLRLSEPAPDDIVPIPFLPEALKITDSDIGSPIEFVGFGQTEAGSAGKKMHFTGEIKWLCDSDSYCPHTANIYGMPHTLCFDQQLGGACEGDSGGPGFIKRQGREFVAAVTSYGDNQGCTIYGCSTKVDAFQDFITDYTGGGLGSDCATNNDCVAGYCVDGLCCESECDSPCHSCSLPGKEGLCVEEQNGASCSDGDLCNGEEVCLLGECVAGTPLDCVDDDPCTDDVCSPTLGCLNDPWPDGYPCGDCMACEQGVCQAADCDAGGGCSTGDQAGTGPGGILLLLVLVGMFALAIRRSA